MEARSRVAHLRRDPASAEPSFGLAELARGFLRRRLGAQLAVLRHPRVHFGRRCDIGPRVRFRVGRGAEVSFGAGCVLDRGTTVECASGVLRVGAGTVFGHDCTLAARTRLEIGERCLVAELVSIRDHDHAFDDPAVPILDQGTAEGAVVIGDDVWLGAKVTVVRGVTIGPGTVVGANAVVTADLPAGVVAVGVPARPVRRRGGAPLR